MQDDRTAPGEPESADLGVVAPITVTLGPHEASALRDFFLGWAESCDGAGADDQDMGAYADAAEWAVDAAMFRAGAAEVGGGSITWAPDDLYELLAEELYATLANTSWAALEAGAGVMRRLALARG